MTYGVPENYDELNEIARLRRLSVTDELTGLLNRRYFFNRLSQEISKSKRNNRPFSLLILDVDHFKEINDTYGHLEGDEVLRVISNVLVQCVREMDIVTRYAGDEFIAILPEAIKEDAIPVAHRILEETRKLEFSNPKVAGATFTVAVSVGLSTFPHDGQTANELIEHADLGLYAAKQGGRNRVCCGSVSTEPAEPAISFDGIIPRFIGRSEEIRQLEEIYHRALEGNLQVVFVAGEAGVGKTRLVEEFLSRLNKDKIQLLKGTCFDTKIPMPYQPFREALASFIERDTYFGYALLRSLSEALKIEVLKVIPNLDTKRLGITSASMGLDPVQDEYRLFDGIYQIMKKISQKGPLVLFLDDLQWADLASLELFSYIVRNGRNDRIMICITFRPEEIIDGNIERGSMASVIHKLSRVHRLDRINVTPLSKNHVAEMLSTVFHPHTCPKELIELVVNETEGNPFFIEELLKTLIENKDIKFEKNHLTIKPAETITLPSSVRDLVLDRIDKLPEELQEILTIAATIGQEFSLPLLSFITGKNEGHIQDILDNGMDANIIKEDFSSAEEKFSFTHCKIREVLYYSLRESKRERLHMKIAHALERLFHNELPNHYEDLAQHYYVTREKEKAFTYMLLCARKVQESYAIHESISYYMKAVSLYDNFSSELQFLHRDDFASITLALGTLFNITGEYEIALKWLNTCREIKDDSHEVYLSLGELHVKRGDYDKAMEMFKIALEKTTLNTALANIETNMSYVYFRVSNFNESERLAKKAIERLQDKALSLVTSEAYKNLGTVYYAKGHFAQAIEYYTKSLEISTLLNDKRSIANSYNNLGSVYYRQNNFDKALDHLQKCLVIREEIGDKSGIVYSYNNIGNIHYNLTDYDNAEKYYSQCLAISNEIGEQAAIIASYNNLGNVYLATEDFTSAAEHYQHSLELSEKIGEKASIARAYTGLGNVYINTNDYLKAYDYYQKCFVIREQIGDMSGMAFASIHMAFASISVGNFEKAEHHFITSGKLKEQINDLPGRLTIINQLIRLYLYTGKNDNARELLVEALDLARLLDQAEMLAETWGLYAILHINDGDTEKAKKAMHTMDKFANSISLTIPVSNFTSFVQGKYELAAHHYKQSLPLFERALKHRRVKNSDVEYGQIMLDFASALIHLQRYAEAAEKLHIAQDFFSKISMKEKLETIQEMKTSIQDTAE
ncbi:MAG: tetratricopeptide repeat protein [Candidatus Auribacterota bacterium]